MSYFFNAEEIFHVAIGIEQNGEEFYLAMSKQAGDKKTQDVCRRLSAEEHSHRLMFERLLNEFLSKKGSFLELKELSEDDLNYIKSLSDSNVFIRPGYLKEASGNIKTAPDVVNLALDFEKDSILFFIQMKKFTRPEWGRPELDKLIAQEQEHIRLLTALLKELG
ncbi:MAG: ferritin family protein [Candidatus Brocadiia bacterium]